MKILKISISLLSLFIASSCAGDSHVPSDAFISDVVGVQEKHLDQNHWVSASKGSKILKSAPDIKIMNERNIDQNKMLYNLSSFPDFLTKEDLISRMKTVSKISKYKRIFQDGTPVTAQDFERYEVALNLPKITDQNPVQFALTVKRTPVRSYPTSDLIFSHDAKNRDIERFQETTLFPADIAVILHYSTDGKWALVQSYNYIGWVKRQDIATGNRAAILRYKSATKFLVMTGAKVFTTYNPDVPEVSEIQLDMGVILPLDRPTELQNNLYGQNPYVSHMVKLPVREPDGSLTFKHALISRVKDVHVGYLPFTEANIITQAFKFLGERYGWGHRYNGRDCTGFTSEIYKSFGILLPRNSGDQGKSKIGSDIKFTEETDSQIKINALKKAKVGDLIYIPGHVMMMLGMSDGQPFIIHDVSGLAYLRPDQTLYRGALNGVSITPILPLQLSKDKSYVDRIYSVKSIR